MDKLGVPRTTFYRWYERYLSCSPEALEDRSPKPSRVWNRIPEPVREKVKDLALKESDLPPRKLAVQFTDKERYFVSEASVYRILESYDLITSPAYVVLSAADEFHDKTTRPNQLWQSIRTSNPIESAFGTIRHRTKHTKGCLSRDGTLHIMFKLRQCAEKSWRKLRGFAHFADVIQGVDFVNGIKPSIPDQAAA